MFRRPFVFSAVSNHFEFMTDMPLESDAAARLVRLRGHLLADMEAMQRALPSDGEETSEAQERRARILSMMARTLDVMTRLAEKKEPKPEGNPQNRQALLAEIEQRLAGLAPTQDPPPSTQTVER